MKKIIVIILSCFPFLLMAQNYSAALISDSLLKNADVVKREEEFVLTIKSPSKYKFSEKYVYTILNESANHYAHFKTFYDKFNTINSLTAILYDAGGKEIKRLKKKDWRDISAEDGMSLMTDYRYKENEFYNTSYPYSVALEEEDEYNGTQAFHRWMPVSNYKMSVQHSKYIIIAPANYVIRYKQFKFSTPPKITQNGDTKTYEWEINNLKALQHEVASPNLTELVPNIAFAPSEFEVDGYKGNMSTWEGYGKFMYQLIKGRDVLPDDIKKKVHEITDHLKTEEEKVDTLYSFLQNNTHYISVQLGIGGWQPFDANYVATKKYGDCKALSNYMISLLKEAGIKAKYIEIYGGNNPPAFMEDFPCSQSNHVICCAIVGKDSIWLECTSQNTSAGYMGDFTGDRKAILIDEDGGHIVQTPIYKASDNVQLTKVKASIDENGNLMAEMNTKYSGLQQEEQHVLIHYDNKEEREKKLNSTINLPTYKVEESVYKEIKGKIPVINEYLKINSPNYASVSGKRIFVQPNLFNKGSKLTPDKERKFDVEIKYAYRDIDSIDIKIPADYKVESMPKDESIKSKFGEYKISYQFDGSNIHLVRLHEENANTFPPTEFTDLVSFRDTIYKADRAKIVFCKKTE